MDNVELNDFTYTLNQLHNQIEKLVSVNIRYKKTIDKLKYELSTIKNDTNENYTIIKNITPHDLDNVIDACISIIDKLHKIDQE